MAKNGLILLKLIDREGRSTDVPLPQEVFIAFTHFISEDKLTGSLTVHFNRGGIAGVETNTRQILK